MASEDPSGFPQSAAPNDGLPKIKSVFDFTAEALEEVAVWLEQRGLSIPITQILGFAQFTANTATPVNTAETTASTAFTDLATVGPSLTGLPDGQYLVLFGFTGFNSLAGDASIMSISANGAVVASDTSPGSAIVSGLEAISVSGWFTTSLKNGGSNSLVAKFRVNAGTGTFLYRRLLVIRFANA